MGSRSPGMILPAAQERQNAIRAVSPMYSIMEKACKTASITRGVIGNDCKKHFADNNVGYGLADKKFRL